MRRHLRYLGALALVVAAAGALSLAAAQPVRELVMAQGVDHEGWDIHDHNTTAYEAIHVNIFDYLVFKDADGVLQPALATSWERIDDLSMRFHLREGVLWHDGEPFTAEDVKFTLERVATDSSLQEYGQYRQIREVEIVGPLEIIIHTHAPEPVLLSRLSRIGSSILAKHHIEAIGGWENISDHNCRSAPAPSRWSSGGATTASSWRRSTTTGAAARVGPAGPPHHPRGLHPRGRAAHRRRAHRHQHPAGGPGARRERGQRPHRAVAHPARDDVHHEHRGRRHQRPCGCARRSSTPSTTSC
jgi:ABC-type transport system substrate-binding protein